MSWSCTCIVGRLRPSSPMRIKNKILIAGVLIPLVGRSSGKSSGSRIWNLRLELGRALHPTPMRTTEFANTTPSSPPASDLSLASPPSYGPPTFAKTWKQGRMSGQDFAPQPDGTLRCPTDHPLYPKARRPERDGTLRVVYAARIGHCRACPLREQCQWHGTSTKKPRRESRGATPTKSGPQARRTTPCASCDLPHSLGRLAASISSARIGQAPSEPSG